MKYLLLALLTLSVVGCASHHHDRGPSSEKSDVSHGVKHNHPYGSR